MKDELDVKTILVQKDVSFFYETNIKIRFRVLIN